MIFLLEVHKVFSQDRVRLPLRSRSSTFPASGRGSSGGLQSFLPRHGTLKRTAEQIADIPVPGGLGQDFPPGGLAAALPAVSQGQHFHEFFRTFHTNLKKCEVSRESESEGAPAGQLMDAGGL